MKQTDKAVSMLLHLGVGWIVMGILLASQAGPRFWVASLLGVWACVKVVKALQVLARVNQYEQ